MKKVFFKILIILIAIIPIFNVSAKTTCEYGKYRLEFDSSGDLETVYVDDVETTKNIQSQVKLIKGECPKKIYSAIIDGGRTIYIRETEDSNVKMTEMEFVKKNQSNKVSCGNVTDIPEKLPKLVSDAITIVQIVVPIILVIIGSIDLIKGVMAQKEDEIKKGQKILIKRLIVAALIFFIVVIVKFLVSLVASSTNSANIVDCIDCFISNKCNR